MKVFTIPSGVFLAADTQEVFLGMQLSRSVSSINYGGPIHFGKLEQFENNIACLTIPRAPTTQRRTLTVKEAPCTSILGEGDRTADGNSFPKEMPIMFGSNGRGSLVRLKFPTRSPC